MMRVLLFVLILLLGSAAGGGVPGLRAQGSPGAGTQPVPGARIRVSAPHVLPRRVTGTVVRITPDTVVLRTGSAESVAVPLDATGRMERSLGRSHDAGAARGLGYGALAGGATMGALVLRGSEFCIYVTCLENNLTGAAGGFLIGAGLGGAAGALIGAIVGVEEWEAVGPVRLRAIHVSPAGIVVGVALP